MCISIPCAFWDSKRDFKSNVPLKRVSLRSLLGTAEPSEQRNQVDTPPGHFADGTAGNKDEEWKAEKVAKNKKKKTNEEKQR
jgi:hypothetical protein